MRASWKVNRSLGAHGPWVIQLAISDGKGGYRFRSPLPTHTNFATKWNAEVVKRTLPIPFILRGVVVDGITISGVAHR
jgi:hypothetical protein